MRPEQAAIASLASMASGNGIFVAHEAAKVNSPAVLEHRDAAVDHASAAVELDKAAADRGLKATSPQDSSEALAAALAAKEADNANVSHPSTPSPTEETAVEQDLATADQDLATAEQLPSALLGEAAEVAEQAVAEASEALQEVTEDVEEAVLKAMAEDINTVAPAEKQAANPYPTAQEPGSRVEAATDILLADQPLSGEISAATVRLEAGKTVQTPTGLLAEATESQHNPNNPLAEAEVLQQNLEAAEQVAAGASSADQAIPMEEAAIVEEHVLQEGQ